MAARGSCWLGFVTLQLHLAFTLSEAYIFTAELNIQCFTKEFSSMLVVGSVL